jgi:hypothetical protein
VFLVKAIYSWNTMTRRPTGRPKRRWMDDVRKDIPKLKYQIGRLSHKIGKDGRKSWLGRPKLYKRVVEPFKKKKMGVPGCGQ